MGNSFYFAVVGVAMVFHIPLAFFSSKEIMDYPLWSKSIKFAWIIFAWLVPFVGFKVVHRKLNLRIKGGNTDGGDTSI